MNPQDAATATPRRRPSIPLRMRPRTATASGTLPPGLEQNTWNRLSFMEEYNDQEDQGSVAEEMNQFSEAVPRRRPSRSFSNLRHPVHGLRALGRRLSVTIRNK